MPRFDVPAICGNCGKHFLASSFESHQKAGRGKYCSRQCAGKHGAKVSDTNKLQIIQMYQDGKDSREIAPLFGCSPSRVLQILRRAGVNTNQGKVHIGSENGMYGRTHTPEARAKIRAANQRQFADETARDRHAILTAQQIAEGRTGKAYNVLETKFAFILKTMGIENEQQHRIGRFVYDFYVPTFRTLIEVHGTFWHADPRFYQPNKLSAIQHRNIANDRRKAERAAQDGYQLLIFWEYDINLILL